MGEARSIFSSSLPLKTSRVRIPFGYRSVPYGEHAIVSYDHGKTWSEPLVLCEARDGDIGYPCTVEMDDGSLFTVYYQRYADDAKTSMLYTRWRL